MAEERTDDKDVPGNTLKEKCVGCIRGPNLIKTIIVVVCLGVVIQQIFTCVEKLINKPITTYTHFDFNKTIMYPSVTLCKEPPYKYDEMMKYGLYAHPRYTSSWTEFNFTGVSLDELWQNITYDAEDIFVQYGLNGSTENVEVKTTLGFVMGRCYTLTPKIASTRASRASGYSITLEHTLREVETSTSVYPPGYHVHIHYNREPFTEVDVYNGGHVDYFYVYTGETIDVKLKVDQYIKIEKDYEPCTHKVNYSANECTSQYVWDLVGKEVGCSGPWMKSKLPHCNTYTTMRRLISSYLNTYLNHNCSSCPRFCRSFLYNSFVSDRQSFYFWDSNMKSWRMKIGAANLQTTLYIYFNGMLVSVYEEQYSYDWNIFLSDLGGSVGFLLGLSVIGLMTMFGKIWNTLVSPFIKTPKLKKDVLSISSDVTVSAKSVKHEGFARTCNNSNAKNGLFKI